jgi:hypothetical protein
MDSDMKSLKCLQHSIMLFRCIQDTDIYVLLCFSYLRVARFVLIKPKTVFAMPF